MWKKIVCICGLIEGAICCFIGVEALKELQDMGTKLSYIRNDVFYGRYDMSAINTRCSLMSDTLQLIDRGLAKILKN